MRERLSSEPDRYRGRRRVPTPKRSRYAAVVASAFVGAGVVALGGRSGWEQLAAQVVARRVELGYQHRTKFAEAAGISSRLLGDIENARRGSYDPATLAKLDAALSWPAGTAAEISSSNSASADEEARVAVLEDSSSAGLADDAIGLVQRSDLPDDMKRNLVHILLAEEEAFEQRQLVRARELIALVSTQEDDEALV